MKIDPKNVHLARTLDHDARLIQCRFDPTGRHVFATAENRTIVRWDLESSDQEAGRTVFQAHDSWVRDLAFSRDGQVLVSAGYDDQLIWWPATAEKPEPIRKVQAHRGWIRTVSVSPDGTLLASAGNDRVVKLWKLEDGSPVRELEGHERDVYSTLFHPSGEFLLSGDLKGQVHQWEVASGNKIRTFDAGKLNTYNGGQQVDYGGVRRMDLSPDRKHLVCSGLHKATNPLGAISQPLVLRLDWDKAELLREHVGDGVEGIGWGALFHKEGFLIGCCGGKSGAHLLFWNAEEEKAFHQFKLPDTLREFDLHPNHALIATAHYDKKLRLSSLEPAPPKES